MECVQQEHTPCIRYFNTIQRLIASTAVATATATWYSDMPI